MTDYYFFKAALKRNLPPTQLKEDLLQLGEGKKEGVVFNYYFDLLGVPGLSEEKGSWVAAQWKTNLGTFSKIAVGQSLTVNQLVDMEWRFGGESCDYHVTVTCHLMHLIYSDCS